ncbi:MAG TPA: hypothetical protein VM555_11270, partial [Tahibacter sp.]|nr:hypothetical protein [Tahibacter sp.]
SPVDFGPAGTFNAFDIAGDNGGVAIDHVFIGPLTAQPSSLSKLTTCLQIALVLVCLLHLSRFGDWPAWINETLFWTVAAATVVSGFDYVLRWGAKAWREGRPSSGDKR